MDTSRTSLIKFYNQPGSSQSSEGGNDTFKKLYCTRQLVRITECMNTSVLDCAVTFTCDKNVCVYGIQVSKKCKFLRGVFIVFFFCCTVGSSAGFNGYSN